MSQKARSDRIQMKAMHHRNRKKKRIKPLCVSRSLCVLAGVKRRTNLLPKKHATFSATQDAVVRRKVTNDKTVGSYWNASKA